MTGGSDRQQLGPNWQQQQFGHWRSRGIDCLGPSATECLLLILDGTGTIIDLAAKTGLSVSVTSGHVRRLRGLGLVRWSCLRGEKITPLCRAIDLDDLP